MYNLYGFEFILKKNDLLEDEMKVKIRIPIWPSRITDLVKFLLLGLRQIWWVWTDMSEQTITKTSLFKYTENFTTKKWKYLDKNSNIFFLISARNIDCGTR